MKTIPFVIALLCACALSFAQTPPATSPAPTTPPKREAGFKAGELAPPLHVAEWVKGAPIPQLENGKVYLVEFWATWCGPCIGNIPHLNALQKKYGKDGLVVIGFSNPDVAPGDRGTRRENNTLDMVRAFVAGRGDRMDYHVAYDTSDKATYKSWMNTIGGIPHAFLIDREGRLAVDYHPFYMDDAIHQVLAGTWDYTEGYKKLRRASELYNVTLGAETYADFQKAYSDIEKENPYLARRMLSDKFGKARLAGDEKEFLPTARSIIAVAREEGNPVDLSSIVRGQLRPRTLHVGEVPADATPEVRKRIEDQNTREKGRFEQREKEELTALKLPLDLLAQMADLACEISKNIDPVALSAKAEVAFARGDAKAAIELQTKAVAIATGYTKAAEEKRLAEFKGGVPTSGS